MRILITGAGGFVGPHLTRYLTARLGRDVEILPTSRDGGFVPGIGDTVALDVTNDRTVESVIRNVRPTHVIHLAGISSLPGADADSKGAWHVNTLGTLAIAEAVLRWVPECWLIFAGSGLVYGATAKFGQSLDEDAILAPTSNYAATKAAADLALGALATRGLKLVRLRLFNHTGPGQAEDFVVSGFAAQIARIEAGHQPPTIRVGSLDPIRDFLDVRDAVAAYTLSVQRAPYLPPGVILNIASGQPRTIRSVLDGLLALSRVPIACEIDPQRLRASETPIYVGNARQAQRLLGWRPRYTFSETLATVLEYWRRIVSG